MVEPTPDSVVDTSLRQSDGTEVALVVGVGAVTLAGARIESGDTFTFCVAAKLFAHTPVNKPKAPIMTKVFRARSFMFGTVSPFDDPVEIRRRLWKRLRSHGVMSPK